METYDGPLGQLFQLPSVSAGCQHTLMRHFKGSTGNTFYLLSFNDVQDEPPKCFLVLYRICREKLGQCIVNSARWPRRQCISTCKAFRRLAGRALHRLRVFGLVSEAMPSFAVKVIHEPTREVASLTGKPRKFRSPTSAEQSGNQIYQSQKQAG